MARRSPVNVGLALALVCVFSYGQADDCRTGCRGTPHTFKYQEGTTYKYNFDSKIQVSLSSAEGQQSLTEVKATVLLTQQPQCNQVLRLQNVQVISNDGKKHTNIPDIEKPIRINYHDGHLEDSICITPGDSQNSLNLKRAVASILQVNLKGGHETDVFGLCPTEVNQHKEGNTIVVEKRRNLNKCAYREAIKQDFLATAFNLNSEIKSSPILNGDYSATLKIKNGVLDQAIIQEKYLYIPFSVGDNGAKANVETTLKYIGTAKDVAAVQCSQPRSIIFEDPHYVTSPHANINNILTAVKQVANTIGLTVGESTAKEFTNLVKILRVSKKDDLLAVYNQVKAGVGFTDKATGKKIFLDALLRAGNGDNIEVAIELLKNKELSDTEQNQVYLGLSAVRHATENSLTSAIILLNLPNLPRIAYLGIGNLAGRYCRQHSCEKIDAVNKLTQKLIQKLGNGKATNRQEEDDIVFALKALGNFHHLNDNILGKITAIAQDKKAANRLRVTALETYLSDPCKDKLRDSALGILKDIQQDSEVRIKAYLAAAQCPNNKVGNAVKVLLESEPSYQVGGFIVSHIRNLRASANPDKELAKQHLGLINVPKRFPLDLRKYSVNQELSYSVDSLGIANSLESNIIYSQNSYLPRSTSFNITTEVFGQNFNFLEIATRQENLDRLIEHYFGPKGLLRSKSLQELWNTKGKETERAINELKEKVQKSLRARRDVTKADIDYVGKQVQVKTNDLNNDLDLDLSIKAFGSELVFLNINDDVRRYTPDAIVDKIVEGLNQGLDKLKNFEETLQKNLLFLDAEFAYPTSSGFPLRLGVEGSSNVQIKVAGSIDIPAILKQDSTIKVKLIPSASVEVAGRLTIDTQVVESGLKVISNLHTATGGDLIINLKQNSVDVKLSLPVEKQNLISVTHDIVFHSREWGAAEVNAPLKFAQNKDFSICLDQLSPFIGLTFCGEYLGPNLQGKDVPILPFPLSGDAKLAVTIEKEDLSQYHFKETVYTDNNKLGAEILLEALGKNDQKKVSLAIEAFLIPEKVIRASLSSPVTSAALEGRIIDTPNEKSISLQLKQDQNEYFGKVGVQIQASASKAIFKPIIQYKTPENSGLQVPAYRVDGQVIVEKKGPSETTYTIDHVKLIIPDQKTITIDGKLGTEPDTLFSDVTVTDGTSTGSFKGKLKVTRNLIKYNAELKNSVNPQGNIRLKGELTWSHSETKNFFQLAHGGDFSDKNNILTLENSYKNEYKSPQDFELEIKHKLTYPAFGTNLLFELELKPKSIDYELNIQYNNVKLGSELEYEYNHKREGTDFKLEFGLWGLNNQLKLKSKRQVTGEQSQIENSLDINGKRIEVNGKIKHHVVPQDIDVAADLIVKLPTHNSPFNVVSGLKLNSNELDASHKVTSGNTVFVDVFLKANRAGNANGSIKINLKGSLVVTGQVRANKGSGNGDILIELPGAGRKSKIDTTFTVHEPTYNILINIYPIFNQDKSAKVTLSTHTSVPQNSFDSQNLIDIFGEKLEVNVKGSQQGELDNGKTNGEIEITLPNQQYLAAKLNRDFRNNNNVINGNGVITIEHRPIKNQTGNKVTLKGQIKNTKPDDNIFDVNYQLSLEAANGKNLNFDLAASRHVKAETAELSLTSKIYGSELSSPIETKIKAQNKKLITASYELVSTYQPLGNVRVSAEYQVGGEGKPVTGNLAFDVSTTSKSLKNLKVKAEGSFLKANTVVIGGGLDVRADSPSAVILEFTSNGEVKANEKETRLEVTIKPGQSPQINIETGLSKSDNKGEKELQGYLSVEHPKGKVKGDFTLTHVSAHEYKLDAKLDLPTDKFKSNRIQVHTKSNDDRTHHQSEVIVTSDGKIWTSNTDLLLSETTPSIEIKGKDPEGKQSQILFKITKATDRALVGQIKLVNQKKNFLLEGTIDANVATVDDFHVKITANAPSLQIDKYVIEAHNKPAKTGRRIQVTAKSGNKNILAGSTSYTAREEHGKLIIEGSGSFKLHDQTKSANFKYIRQNLNQAQNGETGLEIAFDAGLGSKAIDAELKITNKQFRILKSYCEEKKQCAHVEIDVKTSSDDTRYFNQEIEIAVDLRKLGLSHEFGLKSVTTQKDCLLDHTTDIHIQSQDNSKYQYSLYIHPKEAGVSLTTPKRVVSLEANVKVPPNLQRDGGRITSELVFYADKKNQPNQKSGIISFVDVNKKTQTLNGEIRFTNPALRRPLIVASHYSVTSNNFDYSFTADIFAQPDQKITVLYKGQWTDPTEWKKYEYSDSLEIKSSGLGFNLKNDQLVKYSIDENSFKISGILIYQSQRKKYVSKNLLESNPTNAVALLEVANVQIYKITAQVKQSSQNQYIVDGEIYSIGNKPLVSYLEIKNLNTVKYTLAHKETPQDKLQVNAAFIPGQIADFRAEVIKGGATHELGHATVKLDDANFLKSDYNVQSKNIEEFLIKPFQAKLHLERAELEKTNDKIAQEVKEELGNLGEVAKRASPNITPIKQYYVNEASKFKEEILADKTIKDASELLYNILAAISQAWGETFAQFSDLVENFAHTLQGTFGKTLEALEKDFLPKVKELGDKVLHLVAQIADVATNIALTIGAKAAEIAEKYRPELQQLASVLAEVSQDLLRAVVDLYTAVIDVLADQWQQISKEISELPVIEQLKVEYQHFVQQGLSSSEAIANGLKDLFSTFKDLAPTEELKEFIQAISDYITAKLSNQPVDDKAAVDRIVKAGITSVKHILDVLSGEPVPQLQGVKVPGPTNIWGQIPRITAIKLSPVSHLLGEELQASGEFFLSLVNKPRNWVPPFPLYALIAQGQHIFTFDGKHLTFPGNCNYLLARDAVDGNFTIIGTYTNGLLTAISLSQGADTITLKKGGQVLVNNAASELPARKPNIAAYRSIEAIYLVSEYGVRITCGPLLVVCSVSTSGFYHGKLRGLLGNGNNEPYDDFTLPNGKIVTSESEFGNGYKTTSGCAPVQTVSHHEHHPTPTCDKLFGWESNLKYCYPFVPVDNYKLACEHGVAAGVKDTEFAVSVAYVGACNEHNIPVRVPAEYVKCTNGEKSVAVDEEFSVKIPGKVADIVVLVDTTKENEATYKEYVQPLIQQLTTELNTKGVSDVEFHIIAYGGENQWPSHITTDGAKLTFKGKAPNLKFADNPEKDALVTGCPHLDGIVHVIRELGADLKLATGQDLQALTYTEGFQYPFRANAIKTIIAVTGKPCKIGRLYPLQLVRTLLYRGKEINLNLITPVSRDGAKSEAKNIVGFNSRNVYALGATKNKLKHFSDLGKELTYNDYCIDFTVQNDGNVFISDHIHLQPKAQRKQFVQVTSHGIVEQLLSTEKGYDCECKLITPYTAVNICKVVSTKEKPQAKKVGTKTK